MKSSCLSHPEDRPLILIRDEFLAICEGNHCAAALLAAMEYWTNWKRDDITQKTAEAEKSGLGPESVNRELWIYKSATMFSEDLLYLYKEDTVLKGLKYLREKKYILRRRNPRYGWDRTYQYKLNIPVVQAALDNSEPFSEKLKNQVHEPEKSGSCTGQIGFMNTENQAHKLEKSDIQNRKIGSMDRKNQQAIPESTTESTTESTRESTTEQAPAPAQEPTPSPASPAASAVDDDVNPELAKCLLKFGITKNAKTAPIFASDTLKPTDVERVFGEAEQKAKGGTVKNVSGLAIHLLLNYQPAPRDIKEHPHNYGYNMSPGDVFKCDICGRAYIFHDAGYHLASDLICDCGGFLVYDSCKEKEKEL